MIPIETLGAFFAASLLLAIAPGPDNIFVLTQSAMQGRMAGLLVTVGLCTGLIVHTTAVTLGVAAVFQASSLAFTALKLVGAAYLAYLAWRAFRSGASGLNTRTKEDLEGWRLYRRGIFMNVTNPKVTIFFLAFLPQFTDPKRGSLPGQLITLGLIFILATLIVFGGVALTAGSLGEWLKRSPESQRVMNFIAGLVFIGLAIRLATTAR
ncbi:MAG TPA: LysE family translocator [Anaerolineales bacterium]|nr:LysE family translocator [Anaerolineales bacterium]